MEHDQILETLKYLEPEEQAELIDLLSLVQIDPTDRDWETKKAIFKDGLWISGGSFSLLFRGKQIVYILLRHLFGLNTI